MHKTIDLRSDTVTQPTEEMRLAMKNAPVGDDLFRDDPTVIKLEEMAAERLGKEAALFVPSGSMGNQLAIMTHTRPGDEIIVEANCHIVNHEMAAAARLSGVAYALAEHPEHTLFPQDIKRLARPKADPLSAVTSLVCLENALSNGGIVPLETQKAAYQAAKELDLPVHLDGARIFNAAQSLGVDAKEIAEQSDTVMFCISKGLCSPVGSLLCGEQSFIERARKNRKLLGGTMRQAGVLAACGIISLEKMSLRLAEDHENAKYMGKLLSEIPNITVNHEDIKINMVFWKSQLDAFSEKTFIQFMTEKNIKVFGLLDGMYRFVTHHDIDREDIEYSVEMLRAYTESL